MDLRVLSSKNGFTLVEVFVAMVMLGVGVMGFIALQTASIQARTHAQRLTSATQLTSALLDELMVTDPTILTNGSSTVSLDGVTFSQSWAIQGNTPASGLSRVTVTTRWAEKDKNRSVALSAVVTQ